MSALAVATIRQRCAASILAALTADGWQESTSTWDRFGANEGDNLLHKGFAVGVPGWTFPQGRQKQSEGAVCETRVSVRWAYNIGALDQVTSYDEALAAAQTITMYARRIAGVSGAVLVSADHAEDDQGWIMGEVVLRVIHLFALS